LVDSFKTATNDKDMKVIIKAIDRDLIFMKELKEL